jgi:hypothetical protein
MTTYSVYDTENNTSIHQIDANAPVEAARAFGLTEYGNTQGMFRVCVEGPEKHVYMIRRWAEPKWNVDVLEVGDAT